MVELDKHHCIHRGWTIDTKLVASDGHYDILLFTSLIARADFTFFRLLAFCLHVQAACFESDIVYLPNCITYTYVLTILISSECIMQ